jgi:hypothetical protein
VIPIVTPFLMRDDCVTDAARFVARMGSHAHSLHRHVARALDREPDDGAQRAALLAAFSATGRSPDSDVTERLRAALTDEAGDVRAVAALALAQRLGPECDSSVIDVLASLDWEEIPDVVELQTSEDVATCLEEKGTVFLYAVLRQTQTFDDAIGVLCTLAERVTGRYVNRGSRKGRDHSGIDYVELMGAPNPPSEPSSLEELELWRIAASTDVVWAGRTNLFELLGVPADRAELARLAGS